MCAHPPTAFRVHLVVKGKCIRSVCWHVCVLHQQFGRRRLVERVVQARTQPRRAVLRSNLSPLRQATSQRGMHLVVPLHKAPQHARSRTDAFECEQGWLALRQFVKGLRNLCFDQREFRQCVSNGDTRRRTGNSNQRRTGVHRTRATTYGPDSPDQGRTCREHASTNSTGATATVGNVHIYTCSIVKSSLETRQTVSFCGCKLFFCRCLLLLLFFSARCCTIFVAYTSHCEGAHSNPQVMGSPLGKVHISHGANHGTTHDCQHYRHSDFHAGIRSISSG